MAEHFSEDFIEPPELAPEPLKFLVGSWNRFRVLDALEKTSLRRDELMDITGVSRPTLSRILSDLIDRRWIRRQNHNFEATPTGRVIASEIGQVVDNIESAERLDTALEWLRTDLLEFDLAHLATAEILTPSPQDNTKPLRRLADHVDATTEMRAVATGFTYEVVKAICQAGIGGNLQLQCVLDEHALGGVRSNPNLGEMLSDMVESGRCKAYRYLGQDDLIAYNLMDDVVIFCGISDQGLPLENLLSKNDTVRTWAALHFEAVVDDSEPLGGDAFTS